MNANAGKFIIIGSNSFSGSHFINYLLSMNLDVAGISRSAELNDVFLPYKFSNVNRFEFHQLDLNHNIDEIINVIHEFKPNYIVNFAAQGMVAESWKNPEDWYNTNVISQVKLHDHLRKINTLEKYVHVTTPEVYGNTNGWIKENNNFNPSTPYAVSRTSCDLHLISFFKAYHFPVVFTRSANVYGPNQQLYRIIPRAILDSRLGKKFSLHGGGYSKRSFIHINDIVEATYKIAISGVIGSSYHISTLKISSIREIVMMICNQLNINFSDLVDETEDRLGKDQSYMLNSDKIRDELKWIDKIGLEEGISSTIEWVDKNLDILKNLPQKYIHKS